MVKPAKKTVRKKALSSTSKKGPQERKKINLTTTTIVLTEAGYKCANPTCRQILALQLHHMYQVMEGGGDDASNLIALCPSCHSRYHLGMISKHAIYAWKSMLVSLSAAFDLDGIDKLLFLRPLSAKELLISGDGLLHFARLIAAGLAEFKQVSNNNDLIVTYTVQISQKGKMLVDAWKSGDRQALTDILDSYDHTRRA